CNCPPADEPLTPSPADQSPRVRRERRRGKWATVVADLEGDAAFLKELASTLKSALSVGGGVTDGEIVLQGDHRDKVVERLKKLGFRAKAAGG
ncbi:MAG: translation initiation factor, partial [Planctomycetota bacterium]